MGPKVACALFAVLVVFASCQNVQGGASREGLQPADLVIIGGGSYYISTTALGAKSALRAMGVCSEFGMRLLSLHTAAKNDLLRDFLVQSGNGTSKFWTSGKRSEGEWLWSARGEMLSFSDWTSGQPSGPAGEDACLFVLPQVGWFDQACAELNFFVCERVDEC